MLCETMRNMTDAVHEWPLGERVRQARGTESQRSVAKRAGVSAELIWQIENGRRRSDDAPFSPKPVTVEQVARALDIPVPEALRLAGYNPDHHVEPSGGLEVDLARKMTKLEPQEVRAVEILVDSILVARGYMSAPVANVDVVVRSAGEEVRADIESHGEPVNGAAGARQPQGD